MREAQELRELARDEENGRSLRSQVAALHTDLQRETGSVATRSEPAPGTKGGFVDVVLALGTSGALVAAVEILRAWLGRDKTRSITATWTDEDGTTQSAAAEITVT